MSKILAIDTSGSVCTVGLSDAGSLIRQYAGADSRRAAQEVLPMVQRMIDAENLQLGDIDVLAVNTGPGSFTGLRIGIGVTQALAFALKLPIVAIPSMALLAWAGLKQKGFQECLVFEEARAPEVYFAHYRLDNQQGAELNGTEQVACSEDLEISLNTSSHENATSGNSHIGLLGSACTEEAVMRRLSELGFADSQAFPEIVPTMEEFCQLAAVKYAIHGASDDLVLPNYVKEQMEYS